MVVSYYAVFLDDTDGICISFPDIPTCITCADTYSEGVMMAKDVLGLVLHGTAIDDLPISKHHNNIELRPNQKLVEISIEMHSQDGILRCDNVIELGYTIN